MKKAYYLLAGFLLGIWLIGMMGCSTMGMKTSSLVFSAKNKVSDGDLKGSVPVLKEALKDDPNDLEANVTMARVQYLLGHLQRAEKYARIAHQVDSYDFRAMGILGLIDLRQGRDENGIELVSKAMKIFNEIESFGAVAPVEPKVILNNMRVELKKQRKIPMNQIKELENAFWVKVDWYEFNEEYRKWNFNGFYQDIRADGGSMVP